MNLAIVVAIMAAVIGPVLAYYGTVRKLSGSIATSTAEDLWEESRSIRQDYQQRIRELNAVVARCTERIDELDARNTELSKENGRLKDRLEEHESTIAELRTEIHRLTDDNILLRSENTRLKARVNELEEVNER
jgi:chromosome segregation ATPase